MNTSQAQTPPALKTKTRSARVLYENRAAILNQWICRVKTEVDTAGVLIKPIIVNTIPLFIEKLSECLCEETGDHSPSESTNFAQEHGSERARVTRYGPDQVIQEYIILRQVIRGNLLKSGPLNEREENIIHRSIDTAIQESMVSFFLVHGRIREQFVAALTHDLRNPIGAIKLAADLICDAVADGPSEKTLAEIKEITKRILKSAKRADRMIQDMLDASVVQIGEPLALNISEGDLQNIIGEAVSERAPKEVARLKVFASSLSGYWDLEAFRRSIENLITNAFKYGDPNSPVTISANEIYDRVMVSVHNFGNPIPAEARESLFQVFRRAENAKAGGVKGWGIGLALARSTAERMGGSLGVESSLEQGTTFIMDVPRDARPFQNSLRSVAVTKH